MSDDHERIWLQNAIDAGHTEEGRLWCPDKVWPDDPEDGEPTEYVRADLHAAALAEIERLRETEEAYRELFKRSCEKTVYIAECEAEIERLRNSFEPGAAQDIISRQSHEIERLRERVQRAEANEKEAAGQWERMLASYHSADSRAETARSDALEEAARVAESWQVKWVADDIRALKEQP